MKPEMDPEAIQRSSAVTLLLHDHMSSSLLHLTSVKNEEEP